MFVRHLQVNTLKLDQFMGHNCVHLSSARIIIMVIIYKIVFLWLSLIKQSLKYIVLKNKNTDKSTL